MNKQTNGTYLKDLIHEAGDDTIYVIQRHVSSSGMTRYLDFYLIGNFKQPRQITSLVSEILKRKNTPKGMKSTGAGMDMHFEAVYALSCALYCAGKYDHDMAYKLKHVTL